MAIGMPHEYRFAREVILGAAKYCMTHDVSLVHVGMPDPNHLADPRRARAQGLISFAVSPASIKLFRKWGVPLVNTSSRYANPTVPSVLLDNRQIGQIGAKHLLDRGFRSLAYVGIEGHWYSELRAEGFQSAAEAAKVVYNMSNRVEFDLFDTPAESKMAQWLDSLPKPVGVMTCNDIRSRHVLEACQVLGVSVPHDVAILGVDNDEVICQGMDPMLSSVDPNAYRVGYEAASMLHRLMQGLPIRDPVLVAPLGVVPRASTNTAASDDPDVTAALLQIHENAGQPLGVADVAHRLRMSRRTLERRFRRTVGCSIATAIRRAHVERAKQFLIDTDLTLEEVAEAAGLKTVRQLRIVFPREAGTSPSQFRKTFQSSG